MTMVRKRLIYLFVKDLTGGVSGEALENKESRDFDSLSKTEKKVSLWLKVLVWLFVLLLNFGLLFYVYLFAANQTHSRQSAWFVSFVIWLVFEVLVSSTGIVLVFHLLIPLYVLTDLTKIKKKVVEILVSFQRNYLNNKDKDKEEENQKKDEENNNSNKTNEFNSVKYLFVSWKVASLFPEFEESQMILHFKSTFPTKKLVVEEQYKSLSEQYDDSAVLSALFNILTYYITSLLSFHHLFQEIVIQLVLNSGVGYVWITMYRLYKIQPLLPVVPVVFLIVCVHFWMKSYHQQTLDKLKEITPIPNNNEEEEEEEEDEKKKVKTEEDGKTNIGKKTNNNENENENNEEIQLSNQNSFWDEEDEEIDWSFDFNNEFWESEEESDLDPSLWFNRSVDSDNSSSRSSNNKEDEDESDSDLDNFSIEIRYVEM